MLCKSCGLFSRHFVHAAPSGDPRSADFQEPRLRDYLQGAMVESTTTSLPKVFSQPPDIPVSSQLSSVPSDSSGVATALPVQSNTSDTTSPAFSQDNP